MPGIRKRGEEIRDFILTNISGNRNIAVLTSDKFGISLPAVYKHIDRLVSEKQIVKKPGRYVFQTLLKTSGKSGCTGFWRFLTMP